MKARLFAAVALLTILAAACGGDKAPSGSANNGGSTPGGGSTQPGGGGAGTGTGATGGAGGAGGANIVTAADNLTFSPGTLRVKIQTTTGVKVVWRNTGSQAHTVTFKDNSFNKPLPEGGEVDFTFTAPGTTKYTCTIHPGMEGEVVVS